MQYSQPAHGCHQYKAHGYTIARRMIANTNTCPACGDFFIGRQVSAITKSTSASKARLKQYASLTHTSHQTLLQQPCQRSFPPAHLEQLERQQLEREAAAKALNDRWCAEQTIVSNLVEVARHCARGGGTHCAADHELKMAIRSDTRREKQRLKRQEAKRAHAASLRELRCVSCAVCCAVLCAALCDRFQSVFFPHPGMQRLLWGRQHAPLCPTQF